MNDERILGRMEEFKEWASREFDKTREQILKLEEEIESLNQHRWFLDGKIVVITAMCMLVARKLGIN